VLVVVEFNGTFTTLFEGELVTRFVAVPVVVGVGVVDGENAKLLLFVPQLEALGLCKDPDDILAPPEGLLLDEFLRLFVALVLNVSSINK